MFTRAKRWLLLAASAMSWPLNAAADVTNSIPRREPVDASARQWSAIGKLSNESGSTCSGVAIARNKVLTAAHCLFNFRTRQFIAADALHFLAGYRGGKYAAHARVAIYQIGTGFDPLRYSETFDNDWAVLTLTEPLPVTVAPFKLGDQAARGTKAMMAGYPQDRVHALTFDGDCELQERVGGGRLLAHTCRGASGFSGAPILVKNGKEMQVAGIQIARVSANGGSRMMAVPALAVAGADLSAIRPAPKPAAPATVIAGGPSKLKACNLSRPMELAALVDPPPPEHPPGGMLLASIAVL